MIYMIFTSFSLISYILIEIYPRFLPLGEELPLFLFVPAFSSYIAASNKFPHYDIPWC